ncbi:hypothetical protein Poli38472_004311 [Pythium oligandrum]|uniref:Uncharacterized protein n=1 Tax=Pythium oligandrum TaxID=41045 RepID=A0A8K1CMV0_PYTOL|nr:hypothetical protein Poli38472_004311 [Pythium oligandrum]|eukprot:TMW66546.1 hypothetical protein Poli38472_004311 [Pythium oligandrum]
MSEQTIVSPTSVGVAVDCGVATEAELAWMRRCLPIFVQPKVDITNGNQLVKVFFRFEREESSARLDCKLCIVFAGESSYNRVYEHSENFVATLFYRTFNRRTYKRTADINYMEFHNVDLSPDSAMPWESIFSCDYGGEQKWAQGEKANICCWFSLMHHYRVDVPYEEWKRDGARPFVYLNTCNHMIGEHDNNPQMAKYDWTEYAFQEGDADDAFLYVVDHVPTKCNLYSYVCFWKAHNGGGCCDRHHTNSVSRSGKSIYVKAPETSKQALTEPISDTAAKV